jgi:O-antigen ligase
MSVGTQSVASMEQRWRLGPPALIAAASVFIAVLFVTEPFAIAACMFVGLLLAAALHFDLFVYATIFLLPWYPLLNLRFQDAFLPLRFVLFVGVWIQLRRNNKSIREWLLGSKWKKGIWLFAGIAVVSVPLSSTPSNLPAYRSLALLASYFAVFYAIDGWMIDRTRLVRVLKVLLISTIGVALFGLYQAIDGSYTGLYFGLYPIQNENLEPWSGRITSFLFQYNSLAGYLNLVIPLAIACAVLAKDRMLKFLGLVCAFTAAVAVLLTQSRGGLLALAGLFIIAVWLLVPRVTTRIKLVCVVALAGLLLIPPLLNHFDRLENVDDFARLAVWQAAVTMFMDHPLLGVGYGNYRFLYADFVPGAVPGRLDAHNIYFQLLAETGLVGFLSFFALLGVFYALALKAIRKDDPFTRIIAFGVCGAISTTLMHGVVDYLFNTSPQFGALFWLVLGLGSSVLVRSATNKNIYQGAIA